MARDNAAPPNILLITLDQFRADCLSCAAHPVVQTPALDHLAGKGVRLEVNAPAEPIWIDADPTRLAQIAGNLLVNALKFTVSAGTRKSTMGGTLSTTAGKTVKITISVRSPKVNNNDDPVRLDHIDVISGAVTGMIAPTSPEYTTKDTNPSTAVIKTFTKKNWKMDHGWKVMSFTVKATNNMYFRLRGTNWTTGANPTQIDTKGNPLVDELDYIDYPNPKTGGLKPDGTPDLIHGSTPDNAWADLWFYSNPVFVSVR